MATVPVTRTAVTGEVTLASHFNTNIRDPLNFLLAPPIVQLRQTVAQNLTSGSAAALTFTTEDVDSANGHDNSTNPSRYTYVYPGWMSWSGKASYAANALGVRAQEWRKNGAAIDGGGTIFFTVTGGVNSRYPATTMLIFGNVGDYVELWAFQNSGTTPLATVASGLEQSHATGIWQSN